MARNVLLVLSCITLSMSLVRAAGIQYKPHDPVSIVANKVGPFNNPSETYEV